MPLNELARIGPNSIHAPQMASTFKFPERAPMTENIRRNHTRFTGSMIPVALLAVTVTATVCAAENSHGDDPTQTEHPYKVVDGRVDASTYRGWRVFHYSCYGCHGIGAVGTDIAPDLTERVNSMSYNSFATIVRNRYRIVVPSGEGESGAKEAIVREMQRHENSDRGEIIMPAWERTLREKPTLQDLYAYLRARADGALGPDMPGQLDPEAP